MEICAPCYLDGRFPSTMFSGDFVKLTAAAANVAGANSEDWTDEETLLLLEGIEMFDDDWSKIEEHVGTRSAQQCIRRFLELPIEDPYLNSEASMGPLRFGRIPFEQADNPVMSVVAFLAGVVGPGIAAEAAKTALHELTDGKNAGGETKDEAMDGVESDKSKAKDGEEDKMDEDKADAPTATNGASTSEGSSSSDKKPSKTVPHSQVVRAANLALKASSKAAQTLADAEEVQIKSSLASLIKLTLSKLELKMSQFEELEDILEEERRSLESAKMALMNERINIKKTIEGVRSELARNAGQANPAILGQLNMGTTGQGPVVNEVGQHIEGDGAPVPGGEMLQLS
jgi:SWI/SNF related-matrix-associated actin-dependent regulator of chromatin subfamily C